MVGRILFASLLIALCSAAGATDLTLADQAAYGSGTNNIAGSWTHVLQGIGVGVYRDTQTGDVAIAMSAGQQVGPSAGGDFVYSDQVLASDAIIHTYYSATADLGDPAWVDGLHHFVGVDLLSGIEHHYGWLELSLQASPTPTSSEPWYDATIYGWTYETDPNQPVTIPEPSSAAVMLLGLGWALMRR